MPCVWHRDNAYINAHVYKIRELFTGFSRMFDSINQVDKPEKWFSNNDVQDEEKR